MRRRTFLSGRSADGIDDVWEVCWKLILFVMWWQSDGLFKSGCRENIRINNENQRCVPTQQITNKNYDYRMVVENSYRDVVSCNWYIKKNVRTVRNIVSTIASASVVVKAYLQIDSISIFLFVEVVSKTREPSPITIETKAHIKK